MLHRLNIPPYTMYRGVYMLFDLNKKTDLKDIYGRDNEADKLKTVLRGDRQIVVITGVRRVGKSSLLTAVLNDLDTPYVYLDCREIESENYRIDALYSAISDQVVSLSRWSKVFDEFKRVGSLTIPVIGGGINFREDGKPSLTALFKSLNNIAIKKKTQ